MPHDGVPIGGNKHGASAGSQNAECLVHNAIHVGDILGHLSASNNIERSIAQIYIGRIFHSVRQPRWRISPLAECDEITGNIYASNRATPTSGPVGYIFSCARSRVSASTKFPS